MKTVVNKPDYFPEVQRSPTAHAWGSEVVITSNVGGASGNPQPISASQTGQPDPAWTVPTDANGKTDWGAPTTRDPALGFHFNNEEKVAAEQRTAKIIEDVRKTEEAKAEQARIRAGAPVTAVDVMFEYRTPRDVLRQNSPPRFQPWEVPPAIGDFAKANAEATGFDAGGIIVAAVTAAASVIDDRFKLMVRPQSNWSVSARQWSFVCGGPSAGKSPCIRVATDPIKHMHGIKYAQWQSENEGLKYDERTPPPALFTSDATVPALSEKLQGNERGLLNLTEELASLIGGIEASDRGEANKNRGDWLQLRDGGARQIDRISRGSILVPNWGVSVLGACTPDGLAKQLKNMPEDGLIQRFIPCIMGPPNLDASGDARQAIAHGRGRWNGSTQLRRVLICTSLRSSPTPRQCSMRRCVRSANWSWRPKGSPLPMPGTWASIRACWLNLP